MTFVRERFNASDPDGRSLATLVAWLRKQFQAVARALPWAPYVDTRDFVTVAEGADASAQLQKAANAVGTGTLYLAPRTYRLNDDVTIPAATLFKPARGVLINVASGKTLTIAGPIDAGCWQWIDPTSEGAVSCTMNRVYRPEWTGTVGDGETDDLTALDYLTSMLSHSSTVLVSQYLQMYVSGEWIVSALRGFRIVSEVSNLPDGTGPQLIWGGASRLIAGTDANMTFDPLSVANSKIVTTTTGKFTADMVGQRLYVQGAGDSGNGLFGKIATYISSTSVTLDTPCSTTVTNREYLMGPVVLYLRSCDSPVVKGLTVRPMSTACVLGYDGYITATTKTLNSVARGAFTSDMVGKIICVEGVGPSGNDLYTTISGYTNANQITLTDAASVTIGSSTLTRYIIGWSSTAYPARYGILSDESGVGSITGTNGYFDDLLIHQPNDIESYLWATSICSANNQEYHRLSRMLCSGGGSLEWFFEQVSTSAASTTITTSGSVFDAARHTGKRVRIPGAGAAGGLLDTKILSVASATSATIATAATGAVTDVSFHIGQNRAYGVAVGNSSNAKGHKLEGRVALKFCKWGAWQRNGSILGSDVTFTANEADIRTDGGSEPVSWINNNSEQSLRHLDVDSSADDVTLIAPRLGNLQQLGNAGYIRQGNNAAVVHIIGAKFDNDVQATSKLHEFTSTNNHLHLVEPSYQSGITMAEVGIDQASLDASGAWVTVDGHRTISDAPADIFTMTYSGLARGSTSWSGPTSFPRPVSSKSADYTAVATDTAARLRFDATGASRTLTVATTLPVGWWCDVGKIDASANSVTVSGTSCTFNGAASLSTTTQYESWTIIHVGSGAFEIL